MQDTTFLRRYTDLAPLLYLLQNHALTLLSPASWDDKNDSFFLESHRLRRQLKSVLALCFTEASETFHHWRVFTREKSGVCLEFDKTALTAALAGHPGVRFGSVRYETIDDLVQQDPSQTDLPFFKRYPFRDELELRILYEHATNEVSTYDVPFPQSALRKVIVNPWMEEAVYKSVKDTIRQIPMWQGLTVNRTTLVDNRRWREWARVTGQA